MKTKLTNRTVATLKPQDKTYDVRDTEIKGFLVRVRPSGSMTYLLQYRNKDSIQKHFKIGLVGNIKPAPARDMAEIEAGRVAQGIDIQEARKEHRVAAQRARHGNFEGFFDNEYLPWIKEHRKSWRDTETRMRTNFGFLFDRHLTEINAWTIDKWRSQRIKKGASKETINRHVAALKAMLSKAIEWEIIEHHPLTKIKPLKTDKKAKVRYLNDAEEKILRKSLQKRDMKIKSERDSANQWRKERGYKSLPDLKEAHYADHLTPIVLLALNTGMRRGEIFNLDWTDINLRSKMLTVEGETAKSGNTRHIPLNSEVVDTLKNWKVQGNNKGYVFEGKKRSRLDNISSSWTTLITDAKIKNFRFHDLRHSFASKLVMKGVPLNTVRELLGHADLKTTLRYAHLAPDHKADAVALLNQ
jgi:integrase